MGSGPGTVLAIRAWYEAVYRVAPRSRRPYSATVRIGLVYRVMRLDVGIPKMHVQLARYLLRRGHEVHVYGSARDSDPALVSEVTYHDVGLELRSGRVGSTLASARMMRCASAMVRNDLRAGRLDVVHGRGLSSWVQHIAHVPGVYSSERLGLIESRDSQALLRRAKDRAHRFAYPLSTLRVLHERAIARNESVLIHAETPQVARDLEAVHRVDPARIRVVVPGVDVDTFSPEGERVDLGWDGPVIAFLGHDFERKGLDRLLRALARMQTHARLVVIGGGTHVDEGWGGAVVDAYRRLAGELGVAERVRFRGAQRDVAPILRAAHVLAHPARYDVWGLAVTEAMATGLPAVVSRATGASEVVDERSGRVLERADDPDELAAALDALLDPARRADASRAARAAALRISVDRQGALVESDMLRIAEERRDRARPSRGAGS